MPYIHFTMKILKQCFMNLTDNSGCLFTPNAVHSFIIPMLGARCSRLKGYFEIFNFSLQVSCSLKNLHIVHKAICQRRINLTNFRAASKSNSTMVHKPHYNLLYFAGAKRANKHQLRHKWPVNHGHVGLW